MPCCAQGHSWSFPSACCRMPIGRCFKRTAAMRPRAARRSPAPAPDAARCWSRVAAIMVLAKSRRGDGRGPRASPALRVQRRAEPGGGRRRGRDLAVILVTAFRHDMGRDLELPTKEFAAAARAACDAAEAALIIDEVRAGMRLDIRGSWEALGVRPDLCAWSKAIANGYALAAVTGNDKFREAATKVFVTGSFWCGTVAMAAARTTLRIARETDVPGHICAMG